MSEKENPFDEIDFFDADLTREIVGEEIRIARKAKGMTQKEFAGVLGVTQQEVSRIERGDHSLGLDKLEQVSEALNTQLNVNFEPLDLAEYDEDFYVNPNWVFSVGFLKELYEDSRGIGDSIEDFIKTAVEEKLERTECDETWETQFQEVTKTTTKIADWADISNQDEIDLLLQEFADLVSLDIEVEEKKEPMQESEKIKKKTFESFGENIVDINDFKKERKAKVV